MNIKQYLERFNALEETVSLDNLTRLQTLHLQHIPFENLDVIQGVPIYLNLDSIYGKIVTNRRGGYCYELNGLFHSLLTAIGYDAHLISATVLRPNGKWAKADTHAALLVHLDQPYLVDVGFGAATPRRPVPFKGTIKTAAGEIYRIQRQTENTYDLIRQIDGDERTLYRFSSSKKNLIDFHEGCVFNQVSKDSTFTHTDIISIATETGRVSLTNRTLTEVEKGSMKKRELTADEKDQVLKNIFGLCLKNV